MVDQEQSDKYVIFTISLCMLELSETLIALLFQAQELWTQRILVKTSCKSDHFYQLLHIRLLLNTVHKKCFFSGAAS